LQLARCQGYSSGNERHSPGANIVWNQTSFMLKHIKYYRIGTTPKTQAWVIKEDLILRLKGKAGIFQVKSGSAIYQVEGKECVKVHR
jgi:hypothetical protein